MRKENMIDIKEPKEEKVSEPKAQDSFKVIVHPHRKKAKPVEKYKDIANEVEKLKAFIRRVNKHGYHGLNALAIAQPQVNAENPLSYFVDRDLKVYINPQIVEADKPVKSKEKCLSYPFRNGDKNVKRYHRITVEYYDEKMKLQTEECTGLRSAVFQHELDHFEGVYIFDYGK